MNSLIILPNEINGDLAEMHAERAAYLMRAHQLENGIELRAGVWGGQRGHATVLEASPNFVKLQFKASEPPLPREPLHIIVAIPRPQTVKKVLHLATTVGAQALHFVRSDRVERSYLDSHILKEGLQLELLQALEQACDTVPPEVHVHTRFRPFVEDTLPTLMRQYACARGLVAHTGADSKISPQPSSEQDGIFVAIGPESGWNDFEIELFAKAGFKTVSLGQRMLRVEFALAVLVGAVLNGRGD